MSSSPPLDPAIILLNDPSSSSDPAPSGPAFRVPSALLKASQARQSRVKALHPTPTPAPPPAAPTRDPAAPAAAARPSSAGASQRKPPRHHAAVGDTAYNTSPSKPPKSSSRPAAPVASSSSSSSPPAPAAVTAAAAAVPAGTVSEIERIKQARHDRRAKMEALRAARAGMDAVDRANSEYVEQIDKFRGVWRQWIEKWKGKTGSGTMPDGDGVGAEVDGLDRQVLEMGKWDVPIQVCVRKRPAFKKELTKRAIDVVTMTTACYPHASVFVHEPKVGLDQSHTISTQHFAFDKIYDEDAGNDYIYRTTLEPAIPKLFEGENVSLFAYGATGSGKTHTVFGPGGGKASVSLPANIGLYQYACSHVFQMAQDCPGIDLFVSFLEIYSGRVYDLLNGRQQVKLLEQNGNFYFQGLQEYPVTSLAETQALMAHGMSTRSTGSTEVNNTSSRSHAIFRLELRPRPGAASPTLASPAMLSLIDLAGSERGVDTPNSSTDRRREGAAINQSLLALKECIRALHVKSGYVPFRSSKLTCVLRDCFRPEAAATGVGAGSRCIMVLNVAPTSASVEQTLSCLHYANRVKEYSHGGMVVNGGKNVSAQELIEQLAAMSPSPIEAVAGGGFEGEMERAMGQPPVSELLMDDGDDEEAYDEFEGAASDVISRPRSEEELAGYATEPDATLDESEILDLGFYAEADEDGEHGFITPRVMSYDDGFEAAGYDDTKTPVASTLAIDAITGASASQHQQRSRVATYSEDDLMDLHRSTITSMTNLLREEHALMEDRVQGIVDTDVYVTALDILIDEKLRKLLKLKAMAQVVRQMNDLQLEERGQGSILGQAKPPTSDEVRDKVRELRRGPTPT